MATPASTELIKKRLERLSRSASVFHSTQNQTVVIVEGDALHDAEDSPRWASVPGLRHSGVDSFSRERLWLGRSVRKAFCGDLASRRASGRLNEYQCRLLATRGVSSVVFPPIARSGPVNVQAIGRQRNALRYAFEFVDSNSVHSFVTNP